jgi:transposase-like protein
MVAEIGVAEIELLQFFEHAFEGPPCPACHAPHSRFLSTTNEWKYYCRACGRRFNGAGDFMDEVSR